MKSEKDIKSTSGPDARHRNLKSKTTQSPSINAADRHLWQITAARDLLVVILIALCLWLLHALREIVVPLLIALVLAYIFNPLVTWLERKWHWPRSLTVSLLLATVVLGCSALLAWLGPLLVGQITDLARRLPEYLRTLAANYNLDFSQIEETIRQYQGNPQQILAQIFKTTGRAVGFVTAVLSVATYLIFSVTLVLIYFFFLCWGFNSALYRLAKYLPESRKERVVEILSRMDQAIGQFLRGRLLIAIIMGSLVSAGWLLAGVPYWFFLGMLTGLLNIVPYLSVVTWPIAIVLKYVDGLTAGAGQTPEIVSLVVWPSAVYIAVQVLDNWVLTPWIQSGQTNLNAATIIVVVFIGAALAGVMGMLLAIPVASCIKILLDEVFLPRLRRWAAEH
jgi:predicted PurR-regulated permease PerM